MTVLKGGISNIKYVWHATDGACEKCQELNGKEYEYIDDIPDIPHPNCKCWVERINDEPCDCNENFELIEQALGDAMSVQDEVESEIHNIYEFMAEYEDMLASFVPYCLTDLIDTIVSLKIILKSILYFIDNFNQLLAIQDGRCDKYYHAKANCQAAQLGVTGESTAKILSDSKELFDSSVRAVLEAIKNRNDIQETIMNKVKDSEEDQQTNYEGREIGKENPFGDCGEILKYKLPEERRW